MTQEIDYTALAAFRYEIRRFLNFSERAAREAGIEPHQHQALLAIKGLPAGQKPIIAALAERLQIQHHSAVELADRLEASGMIHRLRNKSDRREVLLRLTPQGEKILRRLSVTHQGELKLAGTMLLKALAKAIGGRGRWPRPLLVSGSHSTARRRDIRQK